MTFVEGEWAFKAAGPLVEDAICVM